MSSLGANVQLGLSETLLLQQQPVCTTAGAFFPPPEFI